MSAATVAEGSSTLTRIDEECSISRPLEDSRPRGRTGRHVGTNYDSIRCIHSTAWPSWPIVYSVWVLDWLFRL